MKCQMSVVCTKKNANQLVINAPCTCRSRGMADVRPHGTTRYRTAIPASL